MRRLPLIVTTVLTIGAVGMSVAAAPPPEGAQPGRYSMQPADGGFLRLDTATGDVSLCARTGGELECKPVKDDRDLQSELARVTAENKELKTEIKRLEDMLGLGGGKPPQRKFELPSEQDVDQALSYLERMLKKFRDKLKDLESGMGGEKKGTPL